ncbi:MAG TPA: HAD-IA family hydrolase [Bryobacteraceae bacterium]|jgi:putative hydrolase of the HAD superfamily|nr:HAD-IA family hydrolase [Bryobacteraceae bacterium]
MADGDEAANLSEAKIQHNEPASLSEAKIQNNEPAVPQKRFVALFSDIGGVLGTNGWDTGVRDTICDHFELNRDEIAARHRLMFDSYERGHMTFEQYLKRVFFALPRPFTLEQVRDLAYAQSVAWPENIAFLARVKQANSLKLALISNEGEGITEHRVGKFKLRELADCMVISHFVHLRKPDPEIWQLALDLFQVSAAESIYIDDRPLFADCARDLGFTSLRYVSLAQISAELSALGLVV